MKGYTVWYPHMCTVYYSTSSLLTISPSSSSFSFSSFPSSLLSISLFLLPPSPSPHLPRVHLLWAGLHLSSTRPASSRQAARTVEQRLSDILLQVNYQLYKTNFTGFKFDLSTLNYVMTHVYSDQGNANSFIMMSWEVILYDDLTVMSCWHCYRYL